jgi:septal ring factor EnvC (AmiA/AmiB activator)
MWSGKIKKRLLVIVAIFALTALFSTISSVGFAKGSSREVIKKEKNLEDINKRLREGTKSLEGLSEKESSILSELAVINKRINAVRVDLNRLGKDLKATEDEIKVTKGKLRKLEVERRELSGRLKKRLRAIYMLKSGGAVRVLFSSISTEDLGRRHKYMTLIMGSDLSLIEAVEANYNALSREGDRLEALRVEKEKGYLVYRKKEGIAKREKRVRQNFLRRTRRAKGRQKRLVEELNAAAGELTELIAKLRDTKPGSATHQGFALERGRLKMPVTGKVVSHYGKVKHPRYETITFNNGIRIKAKFGTEVKCVYDGRVAYVGWLKGYGQVMIVGHGGGFYTLFGHLFKVLKERGSTVKEGEVIALVGDSGTDGVAGLYFEVREGGVPRDPAPWFALK